MSAESAREALKKLEQDLAKASENKSSKKSSLTNLGKKMFLNKYDKYLSWHY